MFALVAVVGSFLSIYVEGFAPMSNQPLIRSRSVAVLQESPAKGEWPGDRLPATNPRFLDQRMDAAWGRGKFRTEIWNDNVNPINDWWEAFTPSDEEVEAAAAGFDFSDPEGWCKEHGIDYETAREAGKAVTLQHLAEVLT